VKTYHLDPEKFPKVRRNIIITYIFLAMAGLGVVYLNIRGSLFGSAWPLIPFVLLLFAGACLLAIRQRKKFWDDFELSFKADALYYSAPKVMQIKINKSAVTGVREVRQGLIISTKEKANTLLISKHLSDRDFQEVKRKLDQWSNRNPSFKSDI